MAAEAGVFRGTRIGSVEVRVLKSEAHNLTSTPTMYAVEDGKSIIDHVNLNPNIVQIRCEMTNTNAGTEAARNVMLEFNKSRESREIITLNTEHASYKNMVLIALRPVHEAPYKGALIIDLVFHQAGIVGETSLVSASGGRDARVLSQDGTHKTASGYIFSGESLGVTSGTLIDKCMSILSSLAKRYFA